MTWRCALATLLLCSLMVGCTGERSATPARSRLHDFVCKAGLDTRCVRVGGVTAMVGAGSLDLTKPVVVADEGGPGLDPLAQAGSSPFSGIPNTLILMEPWVLSLPRASCRTALDRYLGEVRGSGSLASPARTFATGCATELDRESRFASRGWENLIAGLRERGVPRFVFVGVSFGAERVAQVASGDDEVVLVAPYVATTSLPRELARRDRRGVRALRLSAADRRRLREVSARLPVRLVRRSVPFTRVDLDAAVIASAYDPDRSAPKLKRELRQLTTALHRGRVVLRAPWLSKAADYLEGRYGTSDYYAGLIGYFGNFCAVSRPGTPVGPGFLSRFHHVCSVLGTRPLDRRPSAAVGCLIASSTDPVASAEGDVKERFPRLATMNVKADGHANVRELALGVEVIGRLIAGRQERICDDLGHP
jgi:hypothetical protein